jgi:hypothetical protein
VLFGVLFTQFAVVSLDALQFLLRQLSLLHPFLYSQEEVFPEEGIRLEDAWVFFWERRVLLGKVYDTLVLIEQKLRPFPADDAALLFNVLLSHLHVGVGRHINTFLELDNLPLHPVLELTKLRDSLVPGEVELEEEAVLLVQVLGFINILQSPLAPHHPADLHSRKYQLYDVLLDISLVEGYVHDSVVGPCR